MDEKIDIKSLAHDKLVKYVAERGLPTFRTRQIEEWLWSKGVTSFDAMTNLSKQLRGELSETFALLTPELLAKQESADGTRKYLFEYADGVSVESVGIPSYSKGNLTVCFSTQAGCAMGCTFCATGQAGFSRNLNIGEMVDQVRLVGEDFGMRVSHIVAMGQGEPFLNYENVLSALQIMNSKIGLGVGARHITVSTCGIISGINAFISEQEQYTLAVSLHSAIQDTRDALMPGITTQLLPQLRHALKAYGDTTKRRPSLEYALIRNYNDNQEHLEALVEFCSGMLSHVNLIPLNPITHEQKNAGMLEPSDKLDWFKGELERQGIEVSIRASRGSDIDGACGQLKQRVTTPATL